MAKVGKIHGRPQIIAEAHGEGRWSQRRMLTRLLA